MQVEVELEVVKSSKVPLPGPRLNVDEDSADDALADRVWVLPMATVGSESHSMLMRARRVDGRALLRKDYPPVEGFAIVEGIQVVPEGEARVRDELDEEKELTVCWR